MDVGGTTASGGSSDGAGSTTDIAPGTTGGTSGVESSTGGTSVNSRARTACSAPASYRNLFVELIGKTQADVDQKLSAAVQQLFHGSSDQAIYFELGMDQAYIQDIANNNVRSEGQS